MRTGALGLAVAAVIAFAAPAHASPEDVANSVASKIASPFCPGVTLENCPSERAVALHARIQSWAEDGWDEERIMTKLESLYGESIRALPPASGTGLGAWLAPLIALILGVGVAAVLARRWTRSCAHDPDARAELPEATRTRIQKELDALRGDT
jgi:cytochrome c-type biogenesis protein CcmH/NrfF